MKEENYNIIYNIISKTDYKLVKDLQKIKKNIKKVYKKYEQFQEENNYENAYEEYIDLLEYGVEMSVKMLYIIGLNENNKLDSFFNNLDKNEGNLNIFEKLLKLNNEKFTNRDNILIQNIINLLKLYTQRIFHYKEKIIQINIQEIEEDLKDNIVLISEEIEKILNKKNKTQIKRI